MKPETIKRFTHYGFCDELAEVLSKKADRDPVDYVAPALGVAAGAAPVAQGISSGALRLGGRGPEMTRGELTSAIRPGDVLLTSYPREKRIKSLIALTGGDPHGYHVEIADKGAAGANRNKLVTIHSHPNYGGAAYSETPIGEQSIIVKRYKNPEHARKMLENARAMEKEETRAVKGLPEAERLRRYSEPMATRAGVVSFLPEKLRNLIPEGDYPAGHTICSTLPGEASPICLKPGVRTNELLPHHIQTSPQLETVGHYLAPEARTLGGRLLSGTLRALPWAARGALGLGLGYGTYRGAQAIVNRARGSQEK